MQESGSSLENRRLRALVRGRVQGVLFRSFTRQHAERLGLVGWVVNLPDGNTMEVVAEGPRHALEELLRHLHEGPPWAKVAQVETKWGCDNLSRAFSGRV